MLLLSGGFAIAMGATACLLRPYTESASVTAATTLPHVTASLNLLTTVLLLLAFAAVRAGLRHRHRWLMLAAVATSALFLVTYLTYHALAPIYLFPGPAALKPYYYTLLISHVLMAAVSAPLVLITLARGLDGWRRGVFARHRALARWTLPVWLYSSVSGLLVYLALYHLFTPEG